MKGTSVSETPILVQPAALPRGRTREPGAKALEAQQSLRTRTATRLAQNKAGITALQLTQNEPPSTASQSTQNELLSIASQLTQNELPPFPTARVAAPRNASEEAPS